MHLMEAGVVGLGRVVLGSVRRHSAVDGALEPGQDEFDIFGIS